MLEAFRRYLKAAEIDARLWMTGKSDPELPPLRLRDVGTGDFRGIGEQLSRLLIDYGRLLPAERVLDIGCGAGRVALPLTKYVTPPGTYQGFDVAAPAIRWCTRHITARHPHFTFARVKVRNSLYSGRGDRAENFVFPFPDKSIDLAFAMSLFTHFDAREVRQYLRETRRVLAPGGRLMATFYLLNESSEAALPRLPEAVRFPVQRGESRIADPRNPAWAVAHQESSVLRLFEDEGFKTIEIVRGDWAGSGTGVTYQDLVIGSV